MNDNQFDQCAAIIEKLDDEGAMPEPTGYIEAIAALGLCRNQRAAVEELLHACIGDTQHAAFRLGWQLARQ